MDPLLIEVAVQLLLTAVIIWAVIAVAFYGSIFVLTQITNLFSSAREQFIESYNIKYGDSAEEAHASSAKPLREATESS